MKTVVYTQGKTREDLREGHDLLEAGDPEGAYQAFLSHYTKGDREVAEALKAARRARLDSILEGAPDRNDYAAVLDFIRSYPACVPKEVRGVPPYDARIAAAIEKARTDPATAHVVSIGNWLESVNDFPGEFEAVALSFQQDPQNPRAHHLMGDLFYITNHRNAARALFTRGLFLPADAKDHYVFHYDLYFLSVAEDGTVKPEQALHADQSIHSGKNLDEHDTKHCPLIQRLSKMRLTRPA